MFSKTAHHIKFPFWAKKYLIWKEGGRLIFFTNSVQFLQSRGPLVRLEYKFIQPKTTYAIKIISNLELSSDSSKKKKDNEKVGTHVSSPWGVL
jgi:hypothetical protein